LRQGSRRIGFLVSGLVHAGLIIVLLMPGASGIETVAQEEQPLHLSLAMFAPSPLPAPVEEVQVPTEPVEPPTEPVRKPERPAEPLQQRRQEPLVEAEAEAEPEPVSRPELLPDPPPEPVAQAESEPPAEPKPRPVHKPPSQPPVAARVRPRDPLSAGQAAPTPAQSDSARLAPPTRPDPVPRPADSARIEATEQAYLARLAALIERHRFYPRMSRRLREQGTVVLRLDLRRDGGFAEVAVSDASGYGRLEEAALETLHKVARFDPIPDVLQRERWSILVPIEYRLR
jgi:protein TonB